MCVCVGVGVWVCVGVRVYVWSLSVALVCDAVISSVYVEILVVKGSR